MPIYSFRCRKCGEEFEVELGMFEPRPEKHECGGDLIRIFHPPGVVYKVIGFSATDKRFERTSEDD